MVQEVEKRKRIAEGVVTADRRGFTFGAFDEDQNVYDCKVYWVKIGGTSIEFETNKELVLDGFQFRLITGQLILYP